MRRSLTLVEVLVAVAIFIILFGIVITFLINYDKFFKLNEIRIRQQEEAKKVFLSVSELLRQAINSTNCQISIIQNNTGIEFCIPNITTTTNNITSLRRVKVFFNQTNNTLLKKEGIEPNITIANNIKDIYFYKESDFKVLMNITVGKDNEFKFNNYTITLRNFIPMSSEGIEIEEETEEGPGGGA